MGSITDDTLFFLVSRVAQIFGMTALAVERIARMNAPHKIRLVRSVFKLQTGLKTSSAITAIRVEI